MSRKPVVDQTVTFAVHRRCDTAAAVVAADDDVLDLQALDSELQHREAIHVGVIDEIRDVCDGQRPSPGARSTMTFAETRLSEHPIQRNLDFAARRGGVKKFGVFIGHGLRP